MYRMTAMDSAISTSVKVHAETVVHPASAGASVEFIEIIETVSIRCSEGRVGMCTGRCSVSISVSTVRGGVGLPDEADEQDYEADYGETAEDAECDDGVCQFGFGACLAETSTGTSDHSGGCGGWEERCCGGGAVFFFVCTA